MTATTNARIAGLTLILYIAAGIASMALHSMPHATEMLRLASSFCALTLGVTLYALTRDQDADIALLALACRLLEAVSGKDAPIYFSVGSTLFCWLFLRGRMIPRGLALLGLAASAFLVVVLPLQRLELLGGPTGWSSSITWLEWLPMLVFEVAFALWLITKGAAPHATFRKVGGN